MKKFILTLSLLSSYVIAGKHCSKEGQVCYCNDRSIPHSAVSYLYKSDEAFESWCNGLTAKSKLPEFRIESISNDQLSNDSSVDAP